MNAHRKSPGDKSSNGKKQKNERKKSLKEKTVAAEIGGTVMREETAKPAPRPAPPPLSEAPASRKPPAPRPAPQSSPERRAEPRPAPPPNPSSGLRAGPPPEPSPGPRPAPRRDAVESAVETMQRSFKAAGRGTVAVNCKLIDFAQANVNCGLDHVKDLAAAKNPVRIMRLQMEYWHDCLANFASQAAELRVLSAELVANANEPIREHMRRSLKDKAA